MEKYQIPPGKYFLGDPCYCFDKSWRNILNETDYLSEPLLNESGEIILLAFNTKYGDGNYSDEHGNSYPVDAGVIGLTEASLIERELKDCGIFVESIGDTECFEEDGVLHFGEFVIDTAGNELYSDEE